MLFELGCPIVLIEIHFAQGVNVLGKHNRDTAGSSSIER